VFAEMVFFILRETWLRKRRALFWIYFSGLILGQVVYMLVNPAVEGIPLYIIFFLGTAVSFFLGNYVLIILLYSRSKGLKTGERKSWVRRLTLFLLLVVTTSIFLDALHLLKALALWSYLLLKSVVIYAVDLLSLVRLKDFIKKIFPEETSPTGMKASIERLFEKHKLTDRERQVTRLICAGKSGREIGNDLFLSPHTIKEYIYRIYKKTGVKNRVQLINLFRDQ